MKLQSNSFTDGQRIPSRYALGERGQHKPIELAANVSPHFAWSDLPERTKSLVLVCHDSDCPSKPDDVNKEGRTVPYDLPRVDFFHWVLVDLDPKRGAIEEGAFSNGVTPHGKSGPDAPLGTRHGLNDYTGWFKGDASMEGQWFGYDGPCPPFNDERVHRYHFTLYALSVERAPVDGTFTGPQVLEAIRPHVLGSAALVGTYAIYPAAR